MKTIKKNSIVVLCAILMISMLFGIGMSTRNLRKTIKSKDTEISNLNTTILGLNDEISAKNETIDSNNITINTLNETIANYEIVISNLELQIEEYKEKEIEISRQDLSSGCNLSKKTYMDYRCISRNSAQGNIVYSDEAWTDDNGLRRYGDYYCVAMGTYYGTVGDILEITTDKGNVYKVILGDIKANEHTDSENKYSVHNGCMLEFIVEEDKLSSNVRTMGSVDGIEEISGKIVEVRRVG